MNIRTAATTASSAGSTRGRLAADDAWCAWYSVFIAAHGRRRKPSHTEAARLEPGNARIQHQLGLLYLSAGDLDNAERHARAALEGGYTNSELIEELKKKGRWNDG